jgi:AcrR family transcriptional regulator
MNKNDLRFQKTEIAIKSTYLMLKKHGAAAVKVKELCQAAMINKTTFYAHYDTIESLHKQVCREFVASILSQCPHIDKLPIDTRAFMFSVLAIFEENLPNIERLYGEDLFTFVNDVEEIFIENYIPEFISEDIKLSIRFCIGGAFKLLVAEKDPVMIQKTVDLVEYVLHAQL